MAFEINGKTLKMMLKKTPTKEDWKKASLAQRYFTNKYTRQLLEENGKIVECCRKAVREKCDPNEYDLEAVTRQILQSVVFSMVKGIFRG